MKALDDAIRTYIKTLPDTCVCCGKSNLGYFHPTDNTFGIQVGHFIDRGVYSLRWDKRNVHPQCSGCNARHRFNTIPYTTYMMKRFGANILEELDQTMKAHKPLKTYQLEELLQLLLT